MTRASENNEDNEKPKRVIISALDKRYIIKYNKLL